jgi:hypothetical protein
MVCFQIRTLPISGAPTAVQGDLCFPLTETYHGCLNFGVQSMGSTLQWRGWGRLSACGRFSSGLFPLLSPVSSGHPPDRKYAAHGHERCVLGC